MSLINDVCWISIPSNKDNRGVLTSIEGGIDIPFCIKRIFYMHHITLDRGGHAHRDTDQVIIAISGAFIFHISDSTSTKTFQLNDATCGLYVPRMLFIEIVQESPNSVCLVLANTHYDKTQSVRTYQQFLEETNSR